MSVDGEDSDEGKESEWFGEEHGGSGNGGKDVSFEEEMEVYIIK